MKNKESVIIKAIVLAGGYSKRMNLKIPKQLAKINNKPLLSYTLDVFEKSKPVKSIILVVHRKYIQKFANLIKKYKYKKVEQLVIGGETRQESVFNALRKIRDCDYIIIQDGVRPFVTQKILSAIIKAVKRFDAVTCAVKATDTIVEAKENFISTTLRRDKLWHIQTPQAFRFDLILQAHQLAKAKKILNASDDAQLLLGLKKQVKLTEGSYKNIKITTKSDFLLVRKMIIQQRATRS